MNTSPSNMYRITDRYTAKETATGWIVGDRLSMRVYSRHPNRAAAEYAAKWLSREHRRMHCS